jgi:hypothetical protein
MAKEHLERFIEHLHVMDSIIAETPKMITGYWQKRFAENTMPSGSKACQKNHGTCPSLQ